MTLPPEISGEYATIRLFAHAKVINPPLTEPCKNKRAQHVKRQKAAAATAR